MQLISSEQVVIMCYQLRCTFLKHLMVLEIFVNSHFFQASCIDSTIPAEKVYEGEVYKLKVDLLKPSEMVTMVLLKPSEMLPSGCWKFIIWILSYLSLSCCSGLPSDLNFLSCNFSLSG